MKIAKKVLSVLLAITMVLGTFVVAASANGDSSSTYQVKYWVTATPIEDGGTWEWSADDEDYLYNDPVWEDSQEGNITVEPGKKYMIAIHCTNNYYAGILEGVLFYDNRLLDAGEIFTYQTQQEASSDRTIWMCTWNSSNPYVKNCVDGNGIQTPSSIAHPVATLTQYNSVMNDDGSYYFGKKLETKEEADATGWGYFLFGHAPNAAKKRTVKMTNTTECLVSFPVQIPDDAKSGTEYKFIMPEENVRREENKKGLMFLSKVPGATQCTADELSKAENRFMNKDQYFDVEGTKITLTVAGSSATDYSALQAKYDAVKDTVVANYNNTADFVAALAAAKTILDEQTADQAAVDSALEALTAGYEKLEVKSADYTALNAAKSSAAAIKADDYEQDANWTAFQTAYTEAQAIATGLDITHQAEISAAATKLTNAIANLTPKKVEADANYTGLDAEIAASQKIADEQSASWYTTDTWSAFTTALANAKAVARDLKESQQATVDAAADALTNARTGLKEADASYTALDALIAEADKLNQSDYTSGSWTSFANALADAKAVARDLKAKNQATIDAAYAALNNAKAGLVALGAADYSKLIAEINNGTTYTQDYYTEESWNAYQTVLAAAQAMVDAGNLKEDAQAEINTMLANLIKAKADLKLVGADYTAVNAAIARIPSTSDLTAYYTLASAQAVIAAKDAVVYGKTKDEQSVVDAYAAEINDKVDALVLLPADTNALKNAIDKAGSFDKDLYTEESYTAMKNELDKANALYNTANLTKKDDQARVDDQAAALTAAITGLVPAGADYTALIAAVDEYEEFVNSGEDEYYTSESKQPYAQAYLAGCDVIDAKYPKSEQAKVDAAVKAINDAKAALVEKNADFTALDENIQKLNTNLTTYKAYLTDEYKATATEAINDANATDFRALKYRNQGTVDEMNNRIVSIFNAPEFKPWDYTKINEAKAAYEAIDRTLYTDESLATVDALFAGIKWDYVQDPVKRGDETTSQYMLARNQEKAVLAWEASLELKPVVEKADYTALDAAIAAADALIAKGTGNYTDDSVKVLQDALAAAKAVARDLTADDQQIVDNATAALNAAMPLTEKSADYTALDAAIALANSKNADDYTDASYAVMTSKLAAAMDLARDLKISAQGTVDKAANELNAAISALVRKPIEVKGSIVSVEWTPSESVYNTFNVKVNNNNGDYANKIQFIDPDGNTRTFARDSASVSIVSYDVNGEVCDAKYRLASYEIWTINTNMNPDVEIKAIAKVFDNGYFWENTDVAYKFTVKLVQPVADTKVYSVTPAATEGAAGRVDVTVVTGLDVYGVRMVMSNGATLTFKTATVDGNQKTFNCKASAYNDGENVIGVQIKIGGEWIDATSFTYTVK